MPLEPSYLLLQSALFLMVGLVGRTESLRKLTHQLIAIALLPLSQSSGQEAVSFVTIRGTNLPQSSVAPLA